METRKVEKRNGKFVVLKPNEKGYYENGKSYSIKGLYNLINSPDINYELDIPDNIESSLSEYEREIMERKEKYISLEQKF